MAASGTPYEARDNIIVPAVYTGLDLRLYTNTSGSLSATTVLADLTFPSGVGYATITLSGAWSSVNGVVTYESDPVFENTDTVDWSGGDVTGAVLTDATYILHYQDLSGGPLTMIPGKQLEIDLSTFIAA